MSKPSQAPLSAIPMPPPRGPFPTEQIEWIAGVTNEVARENAVNKLNWDATVHDWTVANLRNRDFGLPIKAKPDPFVPQVVQTAPDTVVDSGVVWLWISPGTPVVCPDLPPPAVPPGPNHVHVGSNLYQLYWKVGDDNTYNASQPVSATSDDGVTGTWQFVGSAMGAGKGWYLKVG